MKLFEFNRSDKNLVLERSSKFTISLEFELETDDLETSNEETINPQKFIQILKRNAYSYTDSEYKGSKKDMYDLIDEIINELEINPDDIDDDYNLDEVFPEYFKMYKKGFEKDLITTLHADYLTYFVSEDIDYLESKFKENLPEFYSKWENEIKFELDNTLKRGIEFSMNTYIIGIDKTEELIKDFYKEFEKQSYWHFSERTGIHINIGLVDSVEWNPLKGIIMISDEDEFSYTFKDMPWRFESPYTKSLKPLIKGDNILKHVDFTNIKKFEKMFNEWIVNKTSTIYKNYGFNIKWLKDKNYIEFRYPGGDIKKDTLIDKLYYFCYITLLMVDENLKKREYIKKLWKFIK
jgi:hypothetical protein